MTKAECINLYMDLVEVGHKIMKVENKLSMALQVDIPAFNDAYDKLAYTIFDAIVQLKFNTSNTSVIPSEDYEAFFTPRIDQHMADYLELIQENNTTITVDWIEDNINFMLED